MKALAITFFLLCPAAFAQFISVGVRGGVPLTGAFSDRTTGAGEGALHTFSGSNEYLVGPMVELHLPLGFGVEADALYRPLDLNQEFAAGPATERSSSSTNSWEFPILAKFHFLPLPLVKPYVEAGPSFRAIGSGIPNHMSSAGFALGAGVEVKLLKLRVEPELRYIHWGSDGTPAVGPGFLSIAPVSDQNQAEFLVGVAF